MIHRTKEADIHYLRIGSGPPLVLLHGNGEDHRVFLELADALKATYTLYPIDSRNHGSSTSTGDYTYANCARDVIGLLDALALKNAFLLGFSDGGIIGLMVAIERPRLLSGLIVAGANLNPKGLKKSCRQAIQRDYDAYRRSSDLLMLREPDIKKEDLKRIGIPTLVLAGENDLVHRAHTQSIARHIPKSELLILKDHDHYDYILHSSRLEHVIRRFIIQTVRSKSTETTDRDERDV
ncbi:MAG: alpha/beta fold hydrolase [Acholeplasmataceae bacterium]